MPIFEYACEDCNARFEKLVRSAPAQVQCPECGGTHVKKGWSVFGTGNAGAEPAQITGATCGPTGT